MALSPISSTVGVGAVNPTVIQNARNSLEANANQVTPAAQQRQQLEAQLESYTQQLAQAQAAIAQYTQNVQQIQQQMIVAQQQLGLANETNNPALNPAQLNQQNALDTGLNRNNALDNSGLLNTNNRLGDNNPLNPLNANDRFGNNQSSNLAETNNSILGATLAGNNAAGVPGLSTLANTAIANSITPPLNVLPESGAAALEQNSVPITATDTSGKQIDTLI